MQRNSSKSAPDDKLLPMRDVCKTVSLGRATIYKLIKAGSFPYPVRLTPKRVAWRLSDVLHWVADRRTVGWAVKKAA